MFRRSGSQHPRSHPTQASSINRIQPRKPLLYIPESNQEPVNLQALISTALKHSVTEEFSRAEIGLRKAVASLSSLTGGATHSLTLTTTLNLPGMAPALFWMADFLFEEVNQKGDIERFIHKRNHDSRRLLEALNQLDLSNWQRSLVETVSFYSIPPELKFPPSHPIPSKVYRQHPLKSKQHNYYPAVSYYSALFEERETELIQILADLGALKIAIQDLVAGAAGSETVGATQVFDYTDQHWSANMAFDQSKYRWLEHEPTWLRIIESRIHHNCVSASFEFNIDFANTIADQFQAIRGLAKQLQSIHPEDVEPALNQTLQRRSVSVQFAQ